MNSHEKLCRDWIRSYMRPQRCVNHMHSSVGLRMMMEADTRQAVTDLEFKRLMVEEGFEPANWNDDPWEFRISSVPLRARPKAKVNGWLPSIKPLRPTRMG